ncbi:predicted protein [Botrytis cinerea T4]|uniref:Uncharacterized protein n=1 Tax=Botryotinia fuckeliana (strain T4) TaxID=999810 RepID=G2YL01_BOTF4|nr:predicted protein [Botrytis cinerea T4]
MTVELCRNVEMQFPKSAKKLSRRRSGSGSPRYREHMGLMGAISLERKVPVSVIYYRIAG